MGRAGQLCPGSSDVDLPRYSESVVDLNAEIAHGALDLRMAEQELNGAHVAGSAINQRRLSSVERVRPDEARVEANAGDQPRRFEDLLVYASPLKVDIASPLGMSSLCRFCSLIPG